MTRTLSNACAAATVRRRRVAVLMGVFATVVAGPALAQDAESCVAAHTEGQTLREQGKWVEAREAFVKCAVESCPSVVSEECAGLLRSVDKSLPTVVFQARDKNGATLSVKVTRAGAPFLDKLPATAVPLNPGLHELTFRASDGTTIKKSISAVEGQKNQLITVDLVPKSLETPKPPTEAPDESTSGGIPPLAYALGGLAIVGLGSFTYFSLSGKSDQSDLESSCAPGCPPDDYDRMQQKFVIADVSLAVALVAGGAAAWLALGSGKDAERVGVYAVPAGAAASLRGSF